MATKQNAQELAQLIEAKSNEAQGFADMAKRAKESGNEQEAKEAQELADNAAKELQALQAKGTKARTKRVPATKETKAETPQAPTETPQAPTKAAGKGKAAGKAAKADKPQTETPPAPGYIGAPKYMRNPSNLQLSGNRLTSYTTAYLQIRCNMQPGMPLPEWDLFVGKSARTYHRGLGNLTTHPNGSVCLTEKGAQHFGTRSNQDLVLIETYKRMMMTGELPEGMIGEKEPPRKLA